ncbi:M1 family metallopeptidase [Rasiella rasia]|uniref:M1 family metallopeptidase n=1 Tax=Rasiella rasia TaxID=2744027 RepID=A0A6G6GK86_9FLAO|nr:M1 family metallopeptidase [Rasiella rasia]QIE58900.1 M1 family metallopeptidase [Rasiella rasia]
MKYFFLAFFLLSFSFGQSQNFTRADSLRGSITPERAWWDVQYYALDVNVNPEEKFIEGTNTITYTVLESQKVMQIDLQAPMKLEKVVQDNKELAGVSEGAAHFIQLKQKQKKGKEYKITLYFSGKPRAARNAPWDGGWSWKTDTNGKHFIATSNQGIGASIWWPNKDHAYDEPDNGARIVATVPKGLVAVANGRLKQTMEDLDANTYVWEVVNPINNYGININIGDYVNFNEKFEGLNGMLDMDYWVLRDNLEKAKFQFEQAPKMIRAFEYWFGPYPFYEDSFKLVEVPYLGMEHQSSVTYGNGYKNGYRGRDLSDTGWGLQFDFIIVHEGGHEWFANNITHIDVADMWIHEGFTAYAESLYLDYHFGTDAAGEYTIGTRRMIQNDKPLIGVYNVQNEGSSDMYYKGANILHTLRQWVNDDKKWRSILKGLNAEFYHKTVTSKQVENYIAQKANLDLTAFWQQYLRTIQIPKLEYKLDDATLTYRYVESVNGFNMPVIMLIDGKEEWITPTTEWQSKTFSNMIQEAKLKTDFFIKSVQL